MGDFFTNAETSNSPTESQSNVKSCDGFNATLVPVQTSTSQDNEMHLEAVFEKNSVGTRHISPNCEVNEEIQSFRTKETLDEAIIKNVSTASCISTSSTSLAEPSLVLSTSNNHASLHNQVNFQSVQYSLSNQKAEKSTAHIQQSLLGINEISSPQMLSSSSPSSASPIRLPQNLNNINIGNLGTNFPDQNHIENFESLNYGSLNNTGVNASNTSTLNTSLWPNGSVEEPLIPGMPLANGGLPFQNLPIHTTSSVNPMFTSLNSQMANLSTNQGPPRRAITATHNFSHDLNRIMQQQNQNQNLFLSHKNSSNWSSSQASWCSGITAPVNVSNSTTNPGGNIGTNNHTTWNPNIANVHRGRTVHNLNTVHSQITNASRKPGYNVSPSFSNLGSMNIVNPCGFKYRRNATFPSKGMFHPQSSNYEVSSMDDGVSRDSYSNQDLMYNPLPASSPLDNMRGLEQYLSDFIRGSGDAVSQEQIKGFVTYNSIFQSLAEQLQYVTGKASFSSYDDCHFNVDEKHLESQGTFLPLSPSSQNSRSQIVGDLGERYSRKVFVGGLPPDIDEEEITHSFCRFGPLVVDWPHKAESKSYFPPKGYAFLLFQEETSVQALIDTCIQDDDKLYLCVSSPTIRDKPVQIRPWRLSDADYVLDASLPLDPRKTVFVGGVPRPLKALELAMIMNRLYGGVCYAGIDTDPELRYPKGAGRVAFSNQQSYITAISARFVQLQHADIDKRVEVKPYVLDDQLCDECQGAHCGGKFAPFFCANVMCLQYYCEHCWATIHSRPGREFHKPLVKEGADRPRAVPYRWC